MARSMLIIAGLAIVVFIVTALVSLERIEPEVPGVQPSTTLAGADPARGAELIDAYGCGACHEIPGVARADGRVGPPLAGIAERHYIAGTLATSPANLARWIHDPQAIEPGTAMPTLGLTLQEAGDVAAYLYSLER